MAKDSHVNARGNSYDRKRRKEWMCQKFGNGYSAPCWECRKWVNGPELVADRIIPGKFGGTYRRENIRPQCIDCSRIQGYELGMGMARGGQIQPRINNGKGMVNA